MPGLGRQHCNTTGCFQLGCTREQQQAPQVVFHQKLGARRQWLPSSTKSSRAVVLPARRRAASARYGEARNTGCRYMPGSASPASRPAGAGPALRSTVGLAPRSCCGRGRLASGVTKRAGTGNRLPAKCPG
jgi:hypothetical protein